MRTQYGLETVTVYTPGACADINPTDTKDYADQAVRAAVSARCVEGPIEVGWIRREVSVARRDPATQAPEAIDRLRWPPNDGSRRDIFEPMLAYVASMPDPLTVPINVAHIGPFAIASNPGELFVEHGLTIKRGSPFKHTVVAELTNDFIVYEPTRAAFAQQGYETLVGANRVSMEGIDYIVNTTGGSVRGTLAGPPRGWERRIMKPGDFLKGESMPRGGRRPGAGAKKGSKQKGSLEKAELLNQFRARVAAEFEPLVSALFSSATGVTHMMARDKSGKWTRVTDPVVMQRCLESGDEFYKITTQNPDIRALKDIFDRMFGSPTQAVEVTGADGEPMEVRWLT
jgi:hypothetical protein